MTTIMDLTMTLDILTPRLKIVFFFLEIFKSFDQKFTCLFVVKSKKNFSPTLTIIGIGHVKVTTF